MDTKQAINAINPQAVPASGTSPSRRPYQAPQLIPLLQKETEGKIHNPSESTSVGIHFGPS